MGICPTIPRRPAAEQTDANRSTAIFHASLRMLESRYPTHTEQRRQMMLGVGLDPDDTSTDLTSPFGIGIVAGAAVVTARE